MVAPENPNVEEDCEVGEAPMGHSEGKVFNKSETARKLLVFWKWAA